VGGRWPPRASLDGPGVPDESPSIRQTLGAVVSDAGGLLRAEASLAKLETQANLGQLGSAAVRIGLAVALLFLTLVFATVAMVVALATVLTLLWALLIVTGVCLVAGLVVLGAGRARLTHVRLLPEETLGRIAADLDRLSGRTESLRSARAERQGGSGHG
jgi:hypothetical protein